MNRLALVIVVSVAGCGNPSYTITFNPLVNGAPFACGQSYGGIGTTASTMTPIDLRMYVHDVTLMRADGGSAPLQLIDDNNWQAGGIALLDFEDGTGACDTASPETRFVVEGTAPTGNYSAVQFTLGVPVDQDHLDAATAMPPLNRPALWWGWAGGYRYLKMEISSTGNPDGWFFHLGGENCVGATETMIDCRFPDLSVIAVATTVGGSIDINFDVGTVLANSNVDAQANTPADTIPGCMSSPGDPECPPLFASVGLSFENQAAAPMQTAFSGK